MSKSSSDPIESGNAPENPPENTIDTIYAFENAAEALENPYAEIDDTAAFSRGEDANTTSSPQKRRSSLLEILKQERLARLSRHESDKNKQKKPSTARARSYRGDMDDLEFGPLPPADYYYKTDAGQMDDLREGGGDLNYTPVGRNAVEMGSRFYVERNLFSYLSNTMLPFEENFYDDLFVDSACYTRTPNSYIILGKPGIGKATLGRRLAEKLNTIFISPKEVVEHYRDVDKVVEGVKVNQILESGGTIGDKILAKLIQARIAELDVLHIGYVMTGFPMTTSEEIGIEEQIEILETLALPPKYAFVMNMQDADLYKRRIEQKIDPETSIIYGRVHYSKFDPDKNVFPPAGAPRKSSYQPYNAQYPITATTATSVVTSDAGQISDFSDIEHHVPDPRPDGYQLGRKVSMYIGLTNPVNDKIVDPDEPEDPLDGKKDFIPLRPHVIFRLISRTEDNPLIVNDDLELFRDKLPVLQDYLEKFDKRKILELDAYWAPSVILKRAYKYLEACCGVSGIPDPVQILPTPEPPDYDQEHEGEVEVEVQGEVEYPGEAGENFMLPPLIQQPPLESLGEFGGEFLGEYDTYPFRRFGPPKFHRQVPSPVDVENNFEEEAYSALEDSLVPEDEEKDQGPQELLWHVAFRVYEEELHEEDQEIFEALVKLGEQGSSDPIEIPNWRGGGLWKRKKSLTKKTSKGSEEESDEDEGEQSLPGEDVVGEDDPQNIREILASLEPRPDDYIKLLRRLEAERCFGDTKYYCPVTFVEQNLLRKGSPKFACKFRYRLYYCVDEESLDKFLENPTKYLTEGAPHVPPPPRLCITGSPGCGQEEIGLKLARQYDICYINFRQRLHELVKARLGREVGPNKTGNIVNRFKSEGQVSKCKSSDDILKVKFKKYREPGMMVEKEVGGEDEEEEEEEVVQVDEDIEDNVDDDDDDKDEVEQIGEGDDDGVDEGRKIISTDQTLHPFLKETHSEELAINEAAMRTLGLISSDGSPATLSQVPIGSIKRTERLTERKWKKLSKIETYAQAFLENGIQLPDIALDEFIAPLFNEVPFSKVGFILVGFPNTEDDIKYLVKKNLIPEYIFVMECQQLVIRNRLLREAVDRWHVTENPSGMVKKRISYRKKNSWDAGEVDDFSGSEFEGEGAPPFEEFEYVEETWGYNDALSAKITRALKHYHTIFSRNIRSLKISLNQNRVDWISLNTDANLFASKRTLIEFMTPWLKYRSSIFEDTVRITMIQANTMLNYGLYLSRFHRWCPVELYKGNTSLNMWNAPSITKIPIVYRRYIYFIAGEKNAKLFQQNCWDIINQETAMNPVPAVVVIRGPPKSGKTTLAKQLSERLGLVYISGPEMIEGVIKHSFVSQFGSLHHELEPTTLAGCPQAMLLAEEILNYVRTGQTVPKFMMYRVLDLVLEQPKAQYHGIVFDDYPLVEPELQELLYRGVVPSTVIELNIDVDEAKERCKRDRKLDYDYIDPPEDGEEAIEFATMKYNAASETTMDWFKNEVQNTLTLDGTQNMEWIYQKAENKVKGNMKKMQNYLTNILLEKPSTLEGTCPLTSQIPDRVSPVFGFYDPVALNDNDDLVKVANYTNLSEVVEYLGNIYLFANPANLKKFLANPNVYVPPNCARVPPAELPSQCPLTPEEFLEAKNYWGFLDFDPVLYYNSGSQYNGLKRGDPKYCVSYRNKIYIFVSEISMRDFMRKPERFWNQMLPVKVPKIPDPNEMEKITWYSYFIKHGTFTDLKNIILLAGEQRPRVPFTSQKLCATMFMGYYFKCQNMNSPYEIRQKYRKGMQDMMQQKANSKKFLEELKDHYGTEFKNIPEPTRTHFDEFMEMEAMTDDEKILIPTIPGVVLTKAGIYVEENVEEIRTRTKNMKLLLQEVEKKEKMEPFLAFFERKQAMDFLTVDDDEVSAESQTIAAYSSSKG